ncbi:MAG: membrane dipeptidase [Atopobiaceae bacterium]|jgi:membrane dipeptidase|nr:membrane dipeptidase [Atopobiaceae bacterium]
MSSRTHVFDLHCDTLDRLAWPMLPQSLTGGAWGFGPDDTRWIKPGVLQDFATSRGHLSLERMARFAWTQCLAVFVPDTLSPDEAARFFELVSASAERHALSHPDLLGIVSDARDVDSVLESGRTCGILTIEGGTLLAAAPDMVERVARAGVRMLALTWNAANPLASGHDTEQGLTAFGRRVVSELESRRIAIDVSHLNDPGFEELRHIARRPLVASHSNSRAVCDVPRNLTDDQFRAIRDSGGIVGLNYCDHFLVTDGSDPTRDQVLAHVEHWLDLGGEDVVALGSDFDGCDTPSWLSSCDDMGNLADALASRFGSEQAERMLFSNARDFFARNEAL